MSKRSYKGLVLNIILVILVFNVGILGYRMTKDPVDLVEITLNKKVISAKEDLTITIHNYGFRSISFGSYEPIYRVYENDTIKKVKYPENVAWEASLHIIAPLIGSSTENVYTDHLEPGKYLIKKNFKIQGYGEYYKIVSFRVR